MARSPGSKPTTSTAKGSGQKASTKAKKAAKGSAAKKSSPAKKSAKKSATKKAAGAKRPFSAKFLDAQRAALLSERATYTRQADSLRAEAESLVADFEPGDVQFDEESGEGDTLSIERERDLNLSAQARAAVEEIDLALAKFDLGTYGICEASGEPIPAGRLEAIPWARVRVEYKTGGFGRR